MIDRGYVRGYISHSKRVLVLSKKDQFPFSPIAANKLILQNFVVSFHMNNTSEVFEYARAIQSMRQSASSCVKKCTRKSKWNRILELKTGGSDLIYIM